MNPLAEHFRESPFEERVVWFRKVRQGNLLLLLEHLLGEYRLYRATDDDGSDLLDDVSAGNFSCLTAPSSKYYWIDFYSESPPLDRPKFFLTPVEDTWFDVKLYFDLWDFPDPPPIDQLLAKIQQFASMLDANKYSVHYEVNPQGEGGDFSERTLIFSNTNVA